MKFDEELYCSRRSAFDPTLSPYGMPDEITSFSDKEVNLAMQHIQIGKAKDSRGFVAEILKAGRSSLRGAALLQLMNSVITRGTPRRILGVQRFGKR